MITVIAAIIAVWFAFGGPLDHIMGYNDKPTAEPEKPSENA